ncbi:MAG TPA: EF-hand domain-containing protein [Verrucomicrobiae bacterium]|nr:EF-hand domain-containing protein [Verrucomicrobiae bacterium]
MKTQFKLMIAAVAVAGSAACLIAQDNGATPHQRPGRRMPPPPIISVLDANHDGVIDAQEIDNAPAALRTLDKNNDGKLTPDELRPPRPRGHRGGPNGEGRPGDAGGPDHPPMNQDQE